MPVRKANLKVPPMLIADVSALAFPAIDPVAFSIGPLAVRWYGLSYVVSILLAWFYARRIVANGPLWKNGASPITLADLDDFVLWAAVGIVAGGRIGYVLFYDFANVLANPMRAIEVWNGGMSFHGGIAGTTIAMILFARRRGIDVWSLFDLVATVATIGLFLVRIANFINSELWGRVSDAPWAMVFPNGGPFARHPSQIYEALLEGLFNGLVLAIMVYRFGALKRPGLTAGIFVGIYGLARILVENYREPDPQLGYLLGGWLTMGMLLSTPMVLLGAWSIWRSGRAKAGGTKD